jgi:alpha-D-ribose 1-methylphosphonate 5-triphosphate synthase subunit PhnI
MYVAVKGGERAIENAHRLLAHERRGDREVPEISLAQISGQLSLGVDRVMTEGSLYDRELAALAIKQARGDLIEAIFLVRAFRATLPRFGASEPVDTAGMQVRRRISSTFKDIPGGQILGPTFDYTHRLLDPQLAEGLVPEPPATSDASPVSMRRSAISPASRLVFPLTAICGCRIWHAPTRAFCSRSVIRRSAATDAIIRLPARFASARSKWSSWPKMPASLFRSGRSR